MFRVLPQLQYSASRELEKTSLLCEGSSGLAPVQVRESPPNGPGSSADDSVLDAGIPKAASMRRRGEGLGLETEGVEVQARLETLRAAAQKEQVNNELTKQMLAGTPVTYGSIVQLMHVQSRRFVGVLSRTLAEIEKHCTAVELRTKGRPTCYWRVMPRFKYRREGERVAVGDQIVLMSVKGDMYLHCGIASYQIGGHTRREVNASTVRAPTCPPVSAAPLILFCFVFQSLVTGWKVSAYSGYNPKADSCLHVRCTPAVGGSPPTLWLSCFVRK